MFSWPTATVVEHMQRVSGVRLTLCPTWLWRTGTLHTRWEKTELTVFRGAQSLAKTTHINGTANTSVSSSSYTWIPLILLLPLFGCLAAASNATDWTIGATFGLEEEALQYETFCSATVSKWAWERIFWDLCLYFEESEFTFQIV